MQQHFLSPHFAIFFRHILVWFSRKNIKLLQPLQQSIHLAFVLTGLLEGYFLEFRWQMLKMFLSQGFHEQKLQLFRPPIFWLTCGFVLDFMKPEIKINFKTLSNTGIYVFLGSLFHKSEFFNVLLIRHNFLVKCTLFSVQFVKQTCARFYCEH